MVWALCLSADVSVHGCPGFAYDVMMWQVFRAGKDSVDGTSSAGIDHTAVKPTRATTVRQGSVGATIRYQQAHLYRCELPLSLSGCLLVGELVRL